MVVISINYILMNWIWAFIDIKHGGNIFTIRTSNQIKTLGMVCTLIQDDIFDMWCLRCLFCASECSVCVSIHPCLTWTHVSERRLIPLAVSVLSLYLHHLSEISQRIFYKCWCRSITSSPQRDRLLSAKERFDFFFVWSLNALMKNNTYCIDLLKSKDTVWQSEYRGIWFTDNVCGASGWHLTSFFFFLVIVDFFVVCFFLRFVPFLSPIQSF